MRWNGNLKLYDSISLFFRWGNWGTEKQGDFPEVTWQGRTWTRTWVFHLLVFITSVTLRSSLISVLSMSLLLPGVSSSYGRGTGPAVCSGISSQSHSQTASMGLPCSSSLLSLSDHYSSVWDLWPWVAQGGKSPIQFMVSKLRLSGNLQFRADTVTLGRGHSDEQRHTKFRGKTCWGLLLCSGKCTL